MKIPLGYGETKLAFEYDPAQFQVLGTESSLTPLSDAEIGEKLDSPFESGRIEDIVRPNETVLIVVPDATREVASGEIVNLLVRRLIANGTMPHEISAIFAVGIHRGVTEEEKAAILTPFMAQRIKTLAHDSRDLMQIVRLGKTSHGIPVELNRSLSEFDHVVSIGGISYHYFAGFTGGRKSICPGLASSRTIAATHRLAFDFENKCRREGVEVGRLTGNPVHEAFEEVVEMLPPSFTINTIVDDDGKLVDLVCGDWRASHKHACEHYAGNHTVQIEEKRGVVIVSGGGSPHDLNMIQAHKALEMASHACKEGGTILFLAECRDGLGREDFINWFEEGDSERLARRLCEKYQVNGQTAWSLLKKAESFDIRIVTKLSGEICRKMRLKKESDFESAVSGLQTNSSGYIVPLGAKHLISI